MIPTGSTVIAKGADSTLESLTVVSYAPQRGARRIMILSIPSYAVRPELNNLQCSARPVGALCFSDLLPG